ncbi:hypothetical protein V6N13_042239 [Hibiscus sabdariffa]|uniref:Uncharacterized protein n=1 Tax=Hibiscus sabdariffa TaxID=183260 RepID=A0ABR2DHE7_9ROSI
MCDTKADNITVSDRLKHSISDALVYFYPRLVGRRRTNCGLICYALTIPSMDSNIVAQMRDSIKAANNEYVKKLQDGYNHFERFGELGATFGKGDIFLFCVTSLCGFPLYEADFGWGKPVWAATGHRELKNTAVFLDTITGDVYV